MTFEIISEHYFKILLLLLLLIIIKKKARYSKIDTTSVYTKKETDLNKYA